MDLRRTLKFVDKVLDASGRTEENVLLETFEQDYRLILKAIQLPGEDLSIGPTAFQFQMCGRLFSIEAAGTGC